MDRRKHADHYHVLVGLSGYMPNTNYACETLAEARDMAQYEAESFRDAGYCAAYGNDSRGRVTGNKRSGYQIVNARLAPGQSWQTISISECNETECRCAECDKLLDDDGDCQECEYTEVTA